ncbi:hypothetical protein PISL3812_06644 [Talaromyces islandicus]|uniref:Fe2OG dioxygenase domain-containing protein n=1 Tax=Talaromyces islandicus TaxID=28573 RepID=A0A0U1M3K9_TALIS|nr:hypothetical protein PISL3812_06644 [Talaromyces islandicus]
MNAAVLDTELYRSGAEEDRQAFANELVQSLARCGFVKLVNHGIADSLVKELFDWARRFFELSAAQKEVIAHPDSPDPQRGWSRIGAEKTSRLFSHGASSRNATDAREHFDHGSPFNTQWPNRWPDEQSMPGFREFMESYYAASHQTALMILSAMEMGLGIPAGTFVSKCQGTASEMRLNYYPAINIQELRNGTLSRIHPHADLGVITCLLQDGQGGLEMADREHAGQFIPILSRSRSEMIVNISETFQRWSNGSIPSGVHQVTIPPTMKHVESGIVPARYSCAFFVKADWTAPAGALTPFVGEKNPAQYKEMTALEYHQWRLATAY